MSPKDIPQTIPWTGPHDPEDPRWELAPGWVPQHDEQGEWFYVRLAPPHDRRKNPPKAQPMEDDLGKLRPEVRYGKSWWADLDTEDKPPVSHSRHRKMPSLELRGALDSSRSVERALDTQLEKTLERTRSRAMRLNVLEQLTLRPHLFTHGLRADGPFGPLPADQITVTAETLHRQACRPAEIPTGPMLPHLAHEETLRREALGEQLREEFRRFMREAKKSYQQAAQRAIDQV